MNFSIFRSFLTFFNNVTFLFMIDGKSKNRFALNNVYMIVSHLPPFFDRIRTTDFFVIVTLLTWAFDRTFLLLAILSVSQPLQVFVTCLDITFFFIVRLTALFENVNMLLGGIYLRGLTSFSATPLVLIVSVGFECFFDGCILDAIHFSNVSKICIHWMIPPFLCICGTSQPPCYTCDIYFFVSVWRPIQDARHHDIFALSLTR